MLMLDKLLQIFYRVIVIITLLVVLCRVSYRPYIQTFDSNKGVKDTNKFVCDSGDAFYNFIEENSINESIPEENIVGSLTVYPINIDCSIQSCTELPTNLSGVWTKSTKDSFNKDITIIQGNISDKTTFTKINMLEEEKWVQKVQTFNLADANDKVAVYKIFAVTDTLQYEDIKDLDKEQLIALLKEESKFEFETRIQKGRISVLMLNVGIIEDAWIIVGGCSK